LRTPANRYGYEGRGHSLWYCDPFDGERFGWFEVAFMHNAFLQQTSSVVPFACCHRGQMPHGRYFLARKSCSWLGTSLGCVDLDGFIDRWAGWLAAASVGEWNQPSSMPETTIPRNWRS
jgi:hypothetical protein